MHKPYDFERNPWTFVLRRHLEYLGSSENDPQNSPLAWQWAKRDPPRNGKYNVRAKILHDSHADAARARILAGTRPGGVYWGPLHKKRKNNSARLRRAGGLLLYSTLQDIPFF